MFHILSINYNLAPEQRTKWNTVVTQLPFTTKKNTNQVFLIKFLSGQVPSVCLGQIDFFFVTNNFFAYLPNGTTAQIGPLKLNQRAN